MALPDLRPGPQPDMQIREAVMPASSGAVELRPPGGKRVLFFSAEPFAQTKDNHRLSVADPTGDIMQQWNAAAHRLRPDAMHPLPVYHDSTRLPDMSHPDIITNFAGVIGSGAGAMATDRDPWVTRYISFLSTLPEAQVPALLTCFSEQAFAAAAGADVKVNDSGKRKFGAGLYEKTDAGKNHWALKDLDDRFPAFRSHLMVVDGESLPDGVDILARDANDGSVAAIGIGDVFAIQFHTDLSVAAMMGLAVTREKELLQRGLTLAEFEAELRSTEAEVTKTNFTVNGNFNARMHTRHNLIRRT